jgi:transcriptional accessory protein Tex/SPT6
LLERSNSNRLGPKAFQQAAGFLRIRDGAHPLDASAVHPESYNIVDRKDRGKMSEGQSATRANTAKPTQLGGDWFTQALNKKR